MARVQVKDYWLEQRQFERRALVAAALIGALILLLIGRLFLLQIVRHDYYTDLSQGNRVRIEPLPAARGLILDRSGAVLAENSPAYQLELVREEVPNLEDTLQRLVALQLIAPEDLDETRRQILSRRTFDSVPVRLHLEEEEIARFAVHRFEFPGVDINTRLARSYPNGDLAVHALGYVGAISESDLQRIDRGAYAGTSLIGKLGVEAAYEKALHGTNGSREVLVNAQGRSVQKQGAFTPRLRTVSPAPGSDLLLSIDLATQRMAEESLGEHRGAVVAIDPGNGDVLALREQARVRPGPLRARDHARRVRPVEREYRQAPLQSRAARNLSIGLDDQTGHLARGPHRPCRGSRSPDLLYRRVPIYRAACTSFREGKGGKHGHIALREAIASPVTSISSGSRRRSASIASRRFMAPFGYGELTGIDISGEKPGILPSQEWKRHAFKRPQDQVWFPGETVNLGIGQGYLLVTPLQLAHVASVLAGHGKSFQPRLVTGIRDAAGHVALLAPKENKSVDGISDADWDIVYKGMIGATVYGTAALPFKGVKYAAAGKTGTAQVFSVAQNEKYNEKNVNERLRDHAWFIAFAPVEAPRIAVAVLVENGGFGASSAAPIARKVMDTYLLGKTDVKPEAVPAADEGVD